MYDHRRRSTPTLQIGLVIAVLLVSCGRPPGGETSIALRDSLGITIVENHTAPTTTWRLSQGPVIAVGTDGPVEQRPLDPTAVFSGVDGRIIVGDGNQVGWDAVLVYDADGDFLMKIGGAGRGPGEFGGQLWWAGPYRGDSIVAWDRRGPAGPSIKVFGADGGFARDVTIPRLLRERPEGTMGYSVGFHGAFSDGSFLTSSDGILEVPPQSGPAWYRHPLLSVDPVGAAWDTVGEYSFSQAFWDGRRQSQYLYGARGFELPYGDELIRGNSATYEYQVRSRIGAPRLIVRKAFAPEAVDDSDVEAVVSLFLEAAARRQNATEQGLAQLRRTVEGLPRAATKPAYSSILIDHERNVWVERFRWLDPWSIPRDPGPTTWDVFAPSGEWISEVAVPTRVSLLSVSEDRAFGVRIDEMEVRHVVVFELQRSGS